MSSRSRPAARGVQPAVTLKTPAGSGGHDLRPGRSICPARAVDRSGVRLGGSPMISRRPASYRR